MMIGVADLTKRKPVIGLAGGIGSGKSFVASILERNGCAIIDSDQLARDAMSDPEVVAAVRELFGEQVLSADGSVDRKAVAARAFQEPKLLTELEAVIHPKVHTRRHELRQIAQADPTVTAIVEDCPLLFEKQLDSECDRTIFIAASLGTRRQRVAANRGWSDADLAAREKNQLELDIKAQRADYVVNNDGDAAHCEQQVHRVLSRILREIL